MSPLRILEKKQGPPECDSYEHVMSRVTKNELCRRVLFRAGPQAIRSVAMACTTMMERLCGDPCQIDNSSGRVRLRNGSLVRICVLGSAGSGKSSVVSQIVGSTISSAMPTPFLQSSSGYGCADAHRIVLDDRTAIDTTYAAIDVSEMKLRVALFDISNLHSSEGRAEDDLNLPPGGLLRPTVRAPRTSPVR